MVRDSLVSRIAGLVGSLVVLSAATVASVDAKSSYPIAKFGDNKVKLEVASTKDQIERGLMYRTSLPEDHGMVFLFHPEGPNKFWMAHCFISLDMLFIKDGTIVKIFENVPPCKESNTDNCPTYPGKDEPAITVTEVLELSAGYAKRHKVTEGEHIDFELNGRTAKDTAKQPAK